MTKHISIPKVRKLVKMARALLDKEAWSTAGDFKRLEEALKPVEEELAK
jgi:hypothetical protein